MRIVVHDAVGDRSGGDSGAGADDGTLVRAVRRALASLEPDEVRWIDGHPPRRCPPAADCLVYVADRVRRRDLSRHPWVENLSLVVVTGDPCGAALELRRAEVAEIAPGDAREIEAAVRRAVGTGLFERAACLADRGADTSPTLREWLAATLRTCPPFPTVRESAEAVGRSPSTIRRLWRSEVGRSSPKEWLSWIQLMRALQLRSEVGSWDRVAAHLGITRKTLVRAARRLVGRAPARTPEKQREVTTRFERYVRRVLTGPRA